MKLGVRGGNSPSLLGTRAASIINKIQALIWADKTIDGTQIDRIGATTFDAVRPAYVVGDGATYIEDIALANISFTYFDENNASQLGVFDANGKWIIQSFSAISCTIGLYDYKANAQSTITKQGTYIDYISFIPNNVDGDIIHAQVFVQPVIPALYDDSIEGSPLNELGYEVADGITHYTDSALTILYETGTYLQAVEGTNKIAAFISDGEGGSELAPLVNRGRVKYNPRIVDGVVDNGEDYSNWGTVELDADVSLSSDGITWLANVGGFQAIRLEDTFLKDNTLYTFVADVVNSSVTAPEQLTINNSGVNQDSVSIDVQFNGQKRVTFTTKNPILDDYLRLGLVGLTVGEGFKITNVSVYEGDYVTGTPTLPITGEFVQGNTWKLDEAYDLAVKADVNDYAYDDTDPTEVESKLLPCEDAVYGDQLFTSVTKNIVAMYETAQTGQTLANILKKLELYEYAVDSEGVRAVDSEGYYAIAPKSTTTVVE